jgi:hypothetical protein
MKVIPNLGIGDLLILRMRARELDVTTLVIRTLVVRTYRLHADAYLAFLQDFIARLFPGVTIEYDTDDAPSYLEDSPIHHCSLYDEYLFHVPRSVPIDVPYVVLHTRARFDTHLPNFERETLPNVAHRLRSLRSVYPIVLVGEREIEVNKESIDWSIQSLYSIVREIPDIIDMTREDAASNNTIDQFERDLHIIQGAKFNIVFGYGGPLSLSLAFGQRTFGYIGGIQHRVVDDYSNHAFLHRDIDQFLDILQAKLM